MFCRGLGLQPKSRFPQPTCPRHYFNRGKGIGDSVNYRLRNAVKADAKKQRDAYRESSVWLHNSVGFSHSLHLSANNQSILDHLFLDLVGQNVRKREQKRNDLEILVANLIHNRRKATSISLNRNEWKPDQYKTASYFTINLVHTLHRKGLLKMKKGNEMMGRNTRIWVTEKLLEYMPIVPNNVIDVPVELVELRDSKGKLKAYRDTIETARIRAILERVNAVNEKADIRHGRHSLHPALVAIFKERFTLYGRLHTRGYRHYQGFSEEERSEITINGDSVVELDFAGLHPYLLYAVEGKQFFGDPYSIVNERPEARPFLKQILLCLLNSKDETTAEKAANFWLARNNKERTMLHSIGITRARPFIDAFREQHQAIAHHFCTGKETGLRIMNLDAKIALDIVNHFARQNIPVMAVHDSFIVQQYHKDELRRTMQRTYQRYTGHRIAVK